MRITVEFELPEMARGKLLQLSVMANPEAMSQVRGGGMDYVYMSMARELIRAIHS